MKSDVRKEYDRHKKNLSRAVKARKKADRDNIGIDGRKKCSKCNTPYSKFSLKIYKLKMTNSLFCEKCDKEEVEKAVNKQWAKYQKQMEFDPTTWSFSSFYGWRKGRGTHGKYIRQRR